MPFHPEYAKQAYEREARFYPAVQSELFKNYIWQESVRSYELGLRIHDLAMWCQDEPDNLYREIYDNKRTFRNAVRRADVVVMKHGVRVREADVVYRPSKKLLWELGKLGGLFRAVLRDKYLEMSGSHFDHLQEHNDYDRLVYNMDVHRREGNAHTQTRYTDTLWFELRALKLYWDSLITKGEAVDVAHLLKFTSKTLVDVQEAIHTQQFHNAQVGSSQFINRGDVVVLHEFAGIIEVIEKEGLRMQLLGEIWSSGAEGVSFKLKDLYRTICGLAYEPRKAWLLKEGMQYKSYIPDVEYIYRFVRSYEQNMTQPFMQPAGLTDMLDRLRRMVQLDFIQDLQDFLDVYELWKQRVTVNAPYVPPVVQAAQGWQPPWATGTQAQMRALLKEL